MGPISSKAKAKLDVNSKEFLGSGDKGKHVMYLNYFYQNNLDGDEVAKFETFKELICSNEELQIVMDETEIEMPVDASEMGGIDGFFDKMTENQAEQFYNALIKIQG